ncbi:MAG TPA: site-2 protease family protein [Candidatus Eremiobacteraceae bacterium]|nr:site-2 protease family protein [Candidatus Eremiobacteraceae bacterium]
MRIGKIFGIDIVINLSWLFIFAFVAWSLADVGPFKLISVTPFQRVTLGIITALFFFASVLAHELAHSLVARSRGIPIKQITLFIFGGVSSLEGEPSTAPVEAWIAFVGPLTSLVIGIVFFVVSLLLGPKTPLGTATGYLSFANILLGIFNLIPAYPLDGGRVLHALVWRWTKSRLRATQIAAAIGRILAIGLVAYGAFETLYYVGSISGLWLIFIGWFLLQAGGAEQMHAELVNALQGLTARDIAIAAPDPLPADATADVALQLMMKTGSRAFPVVLGDQLLGIITMGDFVKLTDRKPADAYVTSLMTRLADLTSASPGTSAIDILQMLSKSGVAQIPVIDESGKLLGFVTRESILKRLPLQRELRRIKRAA